MVLVTFALAEEGFGFKNRLRGKSRTGQIIQGTLSGSAVAIHHLGLGIASVENFSTQVEKLRPDLLIHSGFAAGIRTLLEPGDFVLDIASSKLCESKLFDCEGKFVQVDHVLDVQQKRELAYTQNCYAADMESGTVSAICKGLSVPFLTAKMISDRFDEEIPGIFLGRGINNVRDVQKAVTFVARMLVLRNRLADRITDLVEAIGN
ncbi:MAG: hypothetical protein JO076_05940 [Verrucomicrobia bacterium]|nr:hypothetical protein [Verrucomicrobiota bacterium]